MPITKTVDTKLPIQKDESVRKAEATDLLTGHGPKQVELLYDKKIADQAAGKNLGESWNFVEKALYESGSNTLYKAVQVFKQFMSGFLWIGTDYSKAKTQDELLQRLSRDFINDLRKLVESAYWRNTNPENPNFKPDLQNRASAGQAVYNEALKTLIPGFEATRDIAKEANTGLTVEDFMAATKQMFNTEAERTVFKKHGDGRIEALSLENRDSRREAGFNIHLNSNHVDEMFKDFGLAVLSSEAKNFANSPMEELTAEAFNAQVAHLAKVLSQNETTVKEKLLEAFKAPSVAKVLENAIAGLNDEYIDARFDAVKAQLEEENVNNVESLAILEEHIKLAKDALVLAQEAYDKAKAAAGDQFEGIEERPKKLLKVVARFDTILQKKEEERSKREIRFLEKNRAFLDAHEQLKVETKSLKRAEKQRAAINAAIKAFKKNSNNPRNERTCLKAIRAEVKDRIVFLEGLSKPANAKAAKVEESSKPAVHKHKHAKKPVQEKQAEMPAPAVRKQKKHVRWADLESKKPVEKQAEKPVIDQWDTFNAIRKGEKVPSVESIFDAKKNGKEVPKATNPVAKTHWDIFNDAEKKKRAEKLWGPEVLGLDLDPSILGNDDKKEKAEVNTPPSRKPPIPPSRNLKPTLVGMGSDGKKFAYEEQRSASTAQPILL